MNTKKGNNDEGIFTLVTTYLLHSMNLPPANPYKNWGFSHVDYWVGMNLESYQKELRHAYVRGGPISIYIKPGNGGFTFWHGVTFKFLTNQGFH